MQVIGTKSNLPHIHVGLSKVKSETQISIMLRIIFQVMILYFIGGVLLIILLGFKGFQKFVSFSFKKWVFQFLVKTVTVIEYRDRDLCVPKRSISASKHSKTILKHS